MSNNLIKTLADGVFFCAVPDSRFNSSSIRVDLYVPLRRETSAQYALISRLFTRTCREYPDYTSLKRRLAMLYGASVIGGVSTTGDYQKISCSIYFLDDRLAPDSEDISGECARLLTSLLFDPALDNGVFSSDEVELERRLLLEQIDAIKNDKLSYARMRASAIMCEGEPFALSALGERESVETVSAEELTVAWKKLLRTARVQLTVVGNVDAEPVAQSFAQAFKGISRSYSPLPSCTVRAAVDNVRNVTERCEATQAKLVMGFRTPISEHDPESLVLRLMSCLYGASSSSLLYKSVREKLSLCYFCFSTYSQMKGVMLVCCGLEEGNAQKAKDEILAQLGRIQSGEYSDEELEAAILGISNACLEACDSISSLTEWYSVKAILSQLRSPEEESGLFAAYSREDISQAARTMRLDTVYLLAGMEEM